jgi:hypothetical protein
MVGRREFLGIIIPAVAATVVSGAYFVSGIVDEGGEASTTSTTSTSTSADEGLDDINSLKW